MAAGFHIENFGCRAARSDGEAIGERLLALGHCVEQLPAAEVVIVNTCSVTAEADREARAFIRRAHRRNPGARIVVTGCYAQRAPEELAGLPGVAAVVGNSHKALVPGIVNQQANESAGQQASKSASQQAGESASQRVSEAASQQVGGAADRAFVDVRALANGVVAGAAPVWVDDRFAHSFLEEAQVAPGAQTRPNLKIQEGCGNRCTFCVIPQTRGGSRSLDAEKVLGQVRGFVAAGGKELVLSGINLGRWGRDLAMTAAADPTHAGNYPGMDGAQLIANGADGSERMTLAGMVRRIFAQTELRRLRLSSIEPMDWDAELMGLMREFGGGRLARHAHLPLQSGSDTVLRRMHRRYRPWHYAAKVAELFEAAGPDLTLGADVMAGFPGETEREFRESCEFIRGLPFGYLHLFPFSPRPGTAGWRLHAEQPVAREAVEERMAELGRIREEKMRAHRSAFVGRMVECLTLKTPEAMRREGWSAALTENFLPVRVAGSVGSNRMVRVRVNGMRADGELDGMVVEA
ncbi:MAG TPA: radical SAM protein [Terracidiphilus sp.]|jgi:threonylcarbamoyladenosine tRNA methylthiotransferase MtaB|nr:radical SAM protein [Terracidiphilus sp.]